MQRTSYPLYTVNKANINYSDKMDEFVTQFGSPEGRPQNDGPRINPSTQRPLARCALRLAAAKCTCWRKGHTVRFAYTARGRERKESVRGGPYRKKKQGTWRGKHRANWEASPVVGLAASASPIFASFFARARLRMREVIGKHDG